MTQPFTHGGLFEGIGGLGLLPFKAAGFQSVWAVEKDRYCQAVIHARHPEVAIYGDIFEVSDLPYVDVLTAGFPCQPYSSAGLRKGADDERYLIPEMMRVISEVQPCVVLCENVPGFTTLNGGLEFRRLLRAFADLGFDVQWGHPRALDFGAPHERERVIIVAHAERRRRRAAMVDQPDARGQSPEAPQPAWAAYARTPEPRDRQPAGRSNIDVMEYADSARRKGLHAAAESNAGDRHSRPTAAPAEPRAADAPQVPESRLDGDSDGLSGRLYGHPGWPSRPLEAQFAYEPPRTTRHKRTNHKARLQALGNAVVPQMIFPIAVAIREWLECEAP